MKPGAYRAISWNPQKLRFDLAALAALALFAVVFAGSTLQSRGSMSPGIVALRGLGAGALLLLHLVLAIGPLSRLDPRFLPLLYNRRHLGVITFLLAAGHGVGSAILYHYNSDIGIVASLLLSNGDYTYLGEFPFEVLGFAALLLLVPLFVTSHDFWSQALTATLWKRFHMLVYLVYPLVIVHVLLGTLQAEKNPVLLLLLATGAAIVVALHVAAGFVSTRTDRRAVDDEVFGYVDLCPAAEIPEGEARAFALAGERVAIIRKNDRITALSNVCEHQGGPLGEGVVRDDCITCPWHGKQYRAEDGVAADGHGGVPTFHVRISQGRVMVDPVPNPPGTPVEPALVPKPLRSQSS